MQARPQIFIGQNRRKIVGTQNLNGFQVGIQRFSIPADQQGVGGIFQNATNDLWHHWWLSQRARCDGMLDFRLRQFLRRDLNR